MIGFIGLLQVVFITLKLTNHIDWSWWWVMSPFIGWGLFTFVLWIGTALYLSRSQ